MAEDAVELYRKYRPQKFSDVVGQKEALNSLHDMYKRGEVPHCILFQGPSGTGKTTFARILRTKLKCSDLDFFEINAADDRGIDMVRNIKRSVGIRPLEDGGSRVWLIDEAHALTGDAQGALLKVLEETPPHAYFFLATTDPGKLKPTIITRCTVVNCTAVSRQDLHTLVKRVAAEEKYELVDDVAEKIAEESGGSARKALVILHQVLGIKDPEEQIKAVVGIDEKTPAFNIWLALTRRGATWPDVCRVLSEVEEDPEGIRRMILAVAAKNLIKNQNAATASLIIEEFRENFFDSGRAGLVNACYNVVAR